MNNLLIFFALPVATIILASVFEKIIESPIAVAATAFAIYLIVTFAAFDETFLIAAIVYTILALISALITRFICDLCHNDDDDSSNNCLVNVLEGISSNNNGNSSNNGNNGCRRRRVI